MIFDKKLAIKYNSFESGGKTLYSDLVVVLDEGLSWSELIDAQPPLSPAQRTSLPLFTRAI